MAKKATLKLKRGDDQTRLFKLPISLYEVGATLAFTAKPLPDNDTLDAAAVISKEFNDSDVDIVSDANYAIYTMRFVPTDTTSITFATGEDEKVYMGEFQYTPLSTGFPTTYPGDNKYVEVTVYADIRRKTP